MNRRLFPLPHVAIVLAGFWIGAATAQESPVAESSTPAAAVDEGLPLLLAAESAMQRTIDRVGPSVVAIARVRRGADNALNNFNFNLPTLGESVIDPRNPDFVPTDFFSGVVLSADGDILTCYHALGDPEQNDYWVWHQGQPSVATRIVVPAEVRAGDPWTDLAVLRIDASELTPITFGDVAAIRRGSVVLSLGNPYAVARDGYPSASFGIVSNLQRRAVTSGEEGRDLTEEMPDSLHHYGTLIQTDAKLNLGTSGGALVDLRGEMIGLTTSLAATTGFETSAGYATPMDEAMQSAIATLREGRQPSFGFLGVEQAELNAQLRRMGAEGVIVRRVVPGLPAAEAGIRQGDIIYAVDDVRIEKVGDLFRELSRRPAFSDVTLKLISLHDAERGPVMRDTKVTLGKKYLVHEQPAYASTPEPTWRGMRVEHLSGLPPRRMFFQRFSRQLESGVAVSHVELDSAAWQAGLRPGYLVTAVEDDEVQTPDQFHAAVENQPRDVTLQIVGDGGVKRKVHVPATTGDGSANNHGKNP